MGRWMTVTAVCHIVKESVRSIGVAKLRAARSATDLCSALMQRRRVGADPISFWGTFRCKRPNSTLAASSGFDQPLMIVLASSPLLELGARLWKVGRHSGIESLAFWPQSEPRFKREPIWPAGRKRNADQTSSMATMDTERHPAALIASRITSRLRFPATFEVFFG